MDREQKKSTPDNLRQTLAQKLAFYQTQLETAHIWPVKADELLLLAEKGHSQEATEADDTMLSLVINDALQGIDIQKKYPAFYKRLTEEAALRDAFLDIMDMVQDDLTEPTTTMPSPFEKLPFLAFPISHPILNILADRWQLTWQQSIAQLNAIFLPQTGLSFRGEEELDDPWFVLLRENVEISGKFVNVFLEATQEEISPDQLHFALAVGIDTLPKDTWPSLSATLTWGEYAATIPLKLQGRTMFPPVLLSQILDEQMTSFHSDLHLLLEPA
ncbi:MAG: hypothetical protein H6636_05110 [Anaerolineales bacterium]|nr:hypothetical protein [Anaerolineales bacterium]